LLGGIEDRKEADFHTGNPSSKSRFETKFQDKMAKRYGTHILVLIIVAMEIDLSLELPLAWQEDIESGDYRPSL
jgi:hypothetical protein